MVQLLESAGPSYDRFDEREKALNLLLDGIDLR